MTDTSFCANCGSLDCKDLLLNDAHLTLVTKLAAPIAVGLLTVIAVSTPGASSHDGQL